MELPFMGTIAADDFRSGTIAAACGGTTTIIDFVIQSAGQTLREALDIWLEKAEGKASIDYGMHLAIGDMDDERIVSGDQGWLLVNELRTPRMALGNLKTRWDHLERSWELLREAAGAVG